MELAGQWRREWAGTAEYGKVTEGGVTRRVARAMEVLNASGPNARVRVMRAAYHSTSGPGVPAASYMLHSSRRVISSGFASNLLESPTYPSKPLEISSTPLESLPDSNMGTEIYKVTEPDDIEISEPSKWRSAANGSSIRMPSEESSSTENASIIDLDTRFSHKGLHRKYSYDSENSDVSSFRRSSSRTSPLLDAPVTLSTLKYKSLLNNSNDWNCRRKSYSFEDTSPLNGIILQSNDTLAMDSSTDSGICKSSELVNDLREDTRRTDISLGKTQNNIRNTESSTDDWHIQNSFHTSSAFKPYKERYFVGDDPGENNIALQSRGKVSITVPITIEGDDCNTNNNQINDDGERKVKRVGFCKTELHFAAESGKVNIIATDEKRPPTNDFKKRRSAFVPINEKFEKPITLFGEKSDFPETSKVNDFEVKSFRESLEYDENTSATKSILKNRIPKPKPYLLGENMVFGSFVNKELSDEHTTLTGVSLINKQLQKKRNDVNEDTVFSLSAASDKSFRDSLRVTTKDPLKVISSTSRKHTEINDNITTKTESQSSVRNSLNFLQMSPAQNARTRQLRESDLTYFGIDNNHNRNNARTTKPNDSYDSFQSLKSQNKFLDDTFASVRLIKQISNSAQNSESESDDSPDYQNFPMKSNFAPVPTPRSRVKYKNSDDRVAILKPIIERANETSISSHESRRSRTRKQEVIIVPANRSLSEPATTRSETSQRSINTNKENSHRRCKDRKKTEEGIKIMDDAIESSHTLVGDDNDVPLYANVINEKNDLQPHNSMENSYKPQKQNRSLENNRDEKISKSKTDSLKKKQNSTKKSSRQQRTEKMSTPEHSSNRKSSDSIILTKSHRENKREQNIPRSMKKHRDGGSLHRTESERIEIKESAPDESIPTKMKSESRESTNHRRKESPKRNSIPKKESCQCKNTEPIMIEHATKSKDLRVVDKFGTDRSSVKNGSRTARRSEYVIKYDDKNGTVSSVSKVRAGHGTTRLKHSSKDNKNSLKDSKAKTKNIDMSALLQLPDHHRIVKGRKEYRMKNTNMSCQLL